MSRDPKEARKDWWGSAEWAAAQTSKRGKLEAELIDAVRASQNATQQLDESAHAALGVSATEGRCLDIVDRGGRVSAGQLASEAGLTTGAVTGILDRLEAKGYLRRIPDPDDRRRILVAVTDKLLEATAKVYWPLKEMSDEWIERRSEEELRLLVEFHRLAQSINERRAAEIRAELAADRGGRKETGS
jgi:DNA-binding MarR family transcriptional regulator